PGAAQADRRAPPHRQRVRRHRRRPGATGVAPAHPRTQGPPGAGGEADMDPVTPAGEPALSPLDPALAQRSTMDSSRGGRTRVVPGEVARTGPNRRTVTELTQQSPVGDALLRGLIRAQLANALRLAAVVAVGLGGLPLLFTVAPVVAGARPLGVGLPWLVLGAAAYPFLFAVAAAPVHLPQRTH